MADHTRPLRARLPFIKQPTALTAGDVISADARSASRMLYILSAFAWGLALIVVATGFAGYGTEVSHRIAIGWLAMMSVVLLFWRRLSINAQKALVVFIVLALVGRWSYAWLLAPPADTVIGIVIGLLYLPVLITIATLLFEGQSGVTGTLVGAAMGVTAMVGGAIRDDLAPLYLDDWRIGPLVLMVYVMYAWLMSIWSRERASLRTVESQLEGLSIAAFTDKLTGLANRRAIEQHLEQLSLGKQRYAVMMADIDHFKQINDRFGHDEGDRVLKDIAKIMDASVRSHDVLARWGGEEFILIVESIRHSEAKRIAENLRRSVELATEKRDIPLTISIGVAFQSSGQPSDIVINEADNCLYTAKRGGRNKVVMGESDTSVNIVTPGA